MKRYGTGRVLAVLFLGMLFGAYKHYDQMRWIGRGREAFVASQNHRFDISMQYHSATSMLVAGILLSALAFGVYELIAVGIARVLPPPTVEE